VKADDRKYVRVYYSVVNDERFAEIYHDSRRFGTWLQLLLVADAMYPVDAPIPAYVHRPSLKALTDCGLIEIRAHQHFRLHGLASEREQRAQSARNAAAKRWQSDGNADSMPRQDEHRQDKTSNRARAGNGEPVLEDPQKLTDDERSDATKRRWEALGLPVREIPA
jgi:hypothetical protein